MSSTEIDALRRLHTDAVDAMNGYTEALKDSDGASVFQLFEEMSDFHRKAASELAEEMIRLGEKPDYNGSFMSTVHRSIMKLRSLVGGLDGSVLPGLIDGEERNLTQYNEALETGGLRAAAIMIVARQREDLAVKVARMRAESMDRKIADLSSSK